MKNTKTDLLDEVTRLERELHVALKRAEFNGQQFMTARREIEAQKSHVRSVLSANKDLLADLERIPRWVQKFFGVDLSY
jgi:predicted  nucleic acid-binding Zn-ribbon protein